MKLEVFMTLMMFLWALAPYSVMKTSALKMVTVCISETLASKDEPSWRRSPER
jgi:hypothetical protein